MSTSEAIDQESDIAIDKPSGPVLSLKDGTLELAVWASDDGKFHNFQLTKSYKSGQQWKKTNTVSSFEALSAANLYAQAYNQLRVLDK